MTAASRGFKMRFLSSIMRTTSFDRIYAHLRIRGAIVPSSARLARELASLALGSDHVLELGAGSGVVTLALTKVVKADKLQVVELHSGLASSLKQRYPHLNVMHGSAVSALDNYPKSGAIAVVSSLPFRSLPADMKHLTVQSLLRFLTALPESMLIQFTYGLKEPFRVSAGFEWRQVKWVMANFPPAGIWVLTKTAAGAGKVDRPAHERAGRAA